MQNIKGIKKNYNLFLLRILLLCFFILNCSSDYFQELSGSYFYLCEGENNKSIISHLPNRKSIFPKIIEYEYNSDFIIAIQQPDYQEYIHMVAFDLRSDTIKYPLNSAGDIIKSEFVADSLLKFNEYYVKIFANKINFWIIAHKQKQVYGPFKREEYLLKRKEVGIPNSLRLKKE